MYRRDVIRALGSLFGLRALATRSVRAAATRGPARSHARRHDRPLQRPAPAPPPAPGAAPPASPPAASRHDALSIEVFGPRGHELRYMPCQPNEIPARLIAAGKRPPPAPMAREVEVEYTEEFQSWCNPFTEGERDRKDLLEPDRGSSRRR